MSMFGIISYVRYRASELNQLRVGLFGAILTIIGSFVSLAPHEPTLGGLAWLLFGAAMFLIGFCVTMEYFIGITLQAIDLTE